MLPCILSRTKGRQTYSPRYIRLHDEDYRMSVRLADRLSAARHRQLVGREAEQALFQSALAAAELPLHVLYVFGPGGVGKTTLLREFVRLCDQAQAPAIYLDARN